MVSFDYEYLADIEGVLCVAHASSGFSKPEVYVNHWPTHQATRDALAWFEVDSIEALTVVGLYTGEYSIAGPHRWQRAQTIRLVNGGKTESIRTDIYPAPRPKGLRKTDSCEWVDGKWHVRSAAGRHRVILLGIAEYRKAIGLPALVKVGAV